MRFRTGLFVAAAVAALTSGWWAAATPGTAPTPALLGDAAACGRYSGLPSAWPRQKHAGMRRVAGGEHQLGSLQGYRDERPIAKLELPAYWIDATETTNAEFAAFVTASGYVTDAERGGGGAVFHRPAPGEAVHDASSWWRWAEGADWRHPDGPDSSIEGRDHEPVVQVTRADAAAYAQWLGRRLPAEAEWEAAARQGLPQNQVDALPQAADGKLGGNFWQGLFPFDDTADDGYSGRAPVGCYAANPLGLYDMIGNVWEWTTDTYAGERQAHGTGDVAAALPSRSGSAAEGVIKGGSYLCASNFCVRYRASARHPQQIDLPTSHIGFRTAADD